MRASGIRHQASGIRHQAIIAAICLLLIHSVLGATHGTSAAYAQTCEFRLGFKALRDQIPDKVGQCLENENFNVENGNAEQRTSGGLMVWRKADNFTAFTDGGRTWVNGPNGLQQRSNTERFSWEKDPPASAAPRTASAATLTPSQPAAAAPQPSVTPAPAATRQPATTAAQPSIDPRLIPAWEALKKSDTRLSDGSRLGDLVPGVAIRTGIPLRVGDLDPKLRGGFGFDSSGNAAIVLNSLIVKEDPRAVATVLAHELVHAGQILIEKRKKAECVVLEVEAFIMGALVWSSFFDDIPPSRTDLEADLTEWAKVYILQGEPAVYERVVKNRGYQDQCDLYVAPTASGDSSPARPSSMPVSAKPSKGELSRRCNAIAAKYIVELIAEGRVSMKDPEEAAEGLAEICKDEFAEPNGETGVDCLEAALKPMPAAVRQKKVNAAQATLIAVAAAKTCQGD